MTYKDAIVYLSSFVDYEKKRSFCYSRCLGLGRVRSFLSSLGNPQDKFKSLHIAGSKGKGSSCVFAAYILRRAGYRVGLYTSPHLIDFRERIRILRQKAPFDSARPGSTRFAQIRKGRRRLSTRLDRARHGSFGSGRAEGAFRLGSTGLDTVRSDQGRQRAEPEGVISRPAFAKLVSSLKPAIDEFNKKSPYGVLTFFEVVTILAFVYFQRRRVDFAVLEAGLGGRLDATNVVRPLACAITPISLEHTGLLGDSLAKIAKEKAGIIKCGRRKAEGGRRKTKDKKLIVVTAPQDSVARDVIIRRCRDVRARLYKLGRDIKIVRLKTGLNGTRFTFEGLNRSYPNLRIRLIGRGQAVNAGLAVAIVEALRFYGIIISAEAIRKGLSEACWPGRFEVCPGHPRIILDGAQNEASALALAETIRELFSKKVILVFGACVDKDVKGMISALLSLSKQLIITRAANPRALSVQEIRRIALTDNPGIRPQLTCSVKQALRIACRDAQDKDIVLITGSLFVVGEAKKCVIATAIMLQK